MYKTSFIWNIAGDYDLMRNISCRLSSQVNFFLLHVYTWILLSGIMKILFTYQLAIGSE